MKTVFTLIAGLAALFQFHVSSAQNDPVMIEPGNCWRYCYCPTQMSFPCYPGYFSVTPDTFNFDGHTYYGMGYDLSGTSQPTYYSYLREEYPAGRIFQRYDTDTTEALLFDFSLQVGDTITKKFQIPYDTLITYHVDSAYTVTLLGKLCRKLVLHSSPPIWTDVWIEGIGSMSYGLMQDPSAFQFLCYSENDTVVFGMPITFNRCTDLECLPNGINEAADIAERLLVYPNPTHDAVRITLPAECNREIRVYDLFGKTVLMHTASMNENETVIDLSALPPGVYMLSTREASAIVVKQ
ncbi:MAG: T9SS type A sorting domain-containing protein [Bacteroidota bacterium]